MEYIYIYILVEIISKVSYGNVRDMFTKKPTIDRIIYEKCLIKTKDICKTYGKSSPYLVQSSKSYTIFPDNTCVRNSCTFSLVVVALFNS